MCIAAWVWQAHPVYQFLLLFNRDEYHDRPTTPVGWWGEGSNQKILGARDELGGGTWLGCTESGRFSFLTNFREPDPRTGTKSRGELPTRFLEGTKCPSEFAQEIAKEADQYNGFNLVVADLCTKTMFYISNRPKGKPISIQEVPPGVHVLSNANMDSPWYKVEKLHKDFSEVLMNYQKEEVCEKEVVKKLMGDKTKADKSLLPNTGCDPEWEFSQSSIFVETDTKLGRYGTRSMAAISVTRSSKVSFYEKYIEDGIWKEHFFQYRIDSKKLMNSNLPESVLSTS